jgi:DNA topoisomerase 2-associated protein PAT1
MLAYAKGKRAIPRIFRFVSNDQRTLIVTMIVAHLDVLDVVKGGLYHANETQLPTAVREEIELFCQTILPPLLQYVSEAPLNIVIGLLGLLLERVDLGLCSQTKLGLQFLTMFLSRGEIIKEAAQAEKMDLSEWVDTYNKLFDRLIPHLHSCFPPASNFVDDIYVWQFLASIAVGATMLQQQQLVEAVK